MQIGGDRQFMFMHGPNAKMSVSYTVANLSKITYREQLLMECDSFARRWSLNADVTHPFVQGASLL